MTFMMAATFELRLLFYLTELAGSETKEKVTGHRDVQRPLSCIHTTVCAQQRDSHQSATLAFKGLLNQTCMMDISTALK